MIDFEAKYSKWYVGYGIFITLIFPVMYICLLFNHHFEETLDLIIISCFFIFLSAVLFITGISHFKKMTLQNAGILIQYLVIKKDKWIDYTEIDGYKNAPSRHGDGIALILKNKKQIRFSGAVCKNLPELIIELESRGVKKIEFVVS